MKRWRDRNATLVLVVALQLFQAPDSLESTCGYRISAKFEKPIISGIIGGEPASITEFPWHVGILSEGQYLCGGTILSEWWILTASHCFIKASSSNLSIVHGMDDFSIPNLMEVKVDKLIIHSDFDSWILDNDIALLLLQSPLSLDVNNVPICLSKATDVQRWNGCLATGWGITHSSELPQTRVGGTWLVYGTGSKPWGS
ncbi:serine protease 52-like [Ochotona princeps]|uniref:serine protease 52-like n=1 Tax=Ochotona princeps TaxID=9978 RepID=UPI002714E5FE|nr:serine protease 52-like [Ochotona princeps]